MKHALQPNVAQEATVVSLRHRYVLVINSKTAGTTLKTIAAKVERELLAAREGSGGDDPAQRIENWLWTPTLADLDASWLGEIYLGRSFFRFTTVRDPLVRCWSAWVDKIVRRHPEFVVNFGAQDWFPGAITGADELVDAFERFVEALSECRGLLGADRHWAPQHLVLQWPAFPYDFVGKTEQFPEVIAEWERATGLEIGRYAEETGHRNANSLALPANLLSDRAWDRLLRIYESDLTAFDYAADRTAWSVDAVDWETDVSRVLGSRHGPVIPERGARRRNLRDGGARRCRRLAVRWDSR